jgi:hypothetical protein
MQKPEEDGDMPQQGVALIARPEFDTATKYGNYYMGVAANYAKNKIILGDLSGPDATKNNINTALSEFDPILCFFLGHGNSDVYTCQNQELYMQTCFGNEVMQNRNLILLSCSCGIRLGPDTANKGAKAVHCWAVDFIWVASGDPPDDYSKGYFEAVNEIWYAHVDGYLPKEAHDRSIAIWNKWIDYWIQSDDEYASLIVQHMINDRDGQRLYGVGDVPSVPVPGVELLSRIELPMILGETLLFLSMIA